MVNIKDIYDSKALIRHKGDISDFINIMHSNNPDFKLVNNYDRTLLVSCNGNKSRDEFEIAFCECIKSWLGEDCPITCQISYVYNILPLTATQFILRI